MKLKPETYLRRAEQCLENEKIVKKIVNLLSKENPRPDVNQCIEILKGCLEGFKEIKKKKLKERKKDKSKVLKTT